MYKNTGFTLIELLVVVLIIGILASVALPQYQRAVEKSRYSTLMSIVKSLADAEEVYYLANGEYTDDFEALEVVPSGCTLSADKKICTYPWGRCILDVSGNDRVGCEDTQFLRNAYVHYFKYGHYSHWGEVCWSLSGTKDDKYGKLCESVGATYLKLAGCPPSGQCYVYRF